MDGPLGLKTYAEQVDRALEGWLRPEAELPERLHSAMRYSALAPGKRIRPALCFESARAVGGDPATVTHAACAVEAVHVFSLIHDDLPAIDNDALRRGRPTCHVQFDEATAILAGDSLFALAFEMLTAVPAPADRLVAAVRELSQTASALVRGEILDILSEGGEPDAEVLEHIHREKTGALLACSCALGASLAGGTPEAVDALRRFGMHLGLAFQIADDVLNEIGTVEKLGKASGSDRERGKLTYPRVYGLEAAQAQASAEIKSALACLDGLPGPTDVLAGLARFVVERQH